MTVMQASIVSTTTTTTDISLMLGASEQCKKAAASAFDALLDMVDTSCHSGKAGDASGDKSADGASGASGNIHATSMTSSIFSLFMSENSAAPSGGFGFSSDFTSAFGDSGPLINWINQITASLHLSREQNAALQNISIEHKDTTASAADVAQIGAELAAAGIG